MADIPFPDGQYFAAVESIRVGANEPTRMALLRHRIMQEQANIALPIVTFDSAPSYDPIRESLHTEGLLLRSSQIVNMHEWLRHHVYDDDPERVVANPEVSFTVDATYDDEMSALVWRIFVQGVHTGENHWDYLRPDGTRYLRTPADSILGTTQVFDQSERIVADLDSLGDLWRWWMVQLCEPGGPVFIFSDCPRVAFALGQLDNPGTHVLHQLHGPHHGGNGEWNSPPAAVHSHVLENLGNLDALVVSTDRQRQDIATFSGASTNLFVIANPSEPTAVTMPLPSRAHGRIVMNTQFEPAKRVDLAIRAFEIVAARNRVAHLDIYGVGTGRSDLERQISLARVNDRISLHNHTSRDAEQFWSADLAWSTSGTEGPCREILEALVRGCPVVAFDVCYGPAELIGDGIGGVLVADNDIEAFAQETLALLADPDRLEAMREPARRAAQAESGKIYLEHWAALCALVQAHKSERTHIDVAKLTNLELHVRGTHPRLTAVLVVVGTGDRSTLKVRWQMWDSDSPAPVDLPVELNLEGNEIHVSGLGVARELPFDAAGPNAAGRLLIEWQNSTQSLQLKPVREVSKVKQLTSKMRHRVR